MPKIVFVDRDDNVIGAGTKQEAWKNGIIHRIVRIFLFNSKGEILIQKRADHLASRPGRWDSSAAGHVDEGEEYSVAMAREMEEELGVRGVILEEIKKFYSDEADGEKIKNRFNMLYTGAYDGPITFNDEVSEVKWVSVPDLKAWMAERPSEFTPGCVISFKILSEALKL